MTAFTARSAVPVNSLSGLFVNSGTGPGPSEEIADREVERVVAHAEDLKLQIVALFHSHPSGSGDLSQADRAALRYSAWPWLVVTRPGRTSAMEMACYASGDAQRIAVIADFGVPKR